MRTLTANEANNMLVLQVRISCSLLSFTTPVSLLANEFDARSVMHGQVSLAAVNHIYVIHGVTNGCKNLKESIKACFETINIDTYTIIIINSCGSRVCPFSEELNALSSSTEVI